MQAYSEDAEMTFEVYARGWLERETKYAPYDRILPTFARNRVPGVGQCHQLKTGAFVLCEKTAKQMQLVGAGLCSARQDTPNYRKSSANPYALTRLAVEADAHIGPAECTVFTGIYGEFVTSQWADRVVGPYNNPSHSL